MYCGSITSNLAAALARDLIREILKVHNRKRTILCSRHGVVAKVRLHMTTFGQLHIPTVSQKAPNIPLMLWK